MKHEDTRLLPFYLSAVFFYNYNSSLTEKRKKKGGSLVISQLEQIFIVISFTC